MKNVHRKGCAAMEQYFDEITENFGFGTMRLPVKDGHVDLDQFRDMVDVFMKAGFHYFDTAHGYMDTESEPAVKACLTDRYPRESYVLTDKLTTSYFSKEEEIRPFMEKQLELCGVDYFDFYLMHAQYAEVYEKFKKMHAYETALQMKKEGKIRHFGISFHDKAAVLDRILTEQPGIEVVQLQFNYVDYEDSGIESRLCYETCRKHHKPVFVMEPIKGGSLVNLPGEARAVFAALGQEDGKPEQSPASYAIRFAAGFDGIAMVLSGMSTIEQLRDNIRFMKNFRKLSAKELEAVGKVRDIFLSQKLIPCTACRYCTSGCPKQIDIPEFFSCMNAKKQFNDFNSGWFYYMHSQRGGKASDCIGCGQCEKSCPQHLPIRELLRDIAAEFEKPQENE